jgi:hypothetical protein
VDRLFVVTHPHPVELEARPIGHDAAPEGAVALGYFHRGQIFARGVVAAEALDAIEGLLRKPVSVALAATEDESGNIDARVCLVLPVDSEDLLGGSDDDETDEPWKASVPAPPPEAAGGETQQDDEPRVALLPIGHVVRGARYRNHGDVPSDAREMLDNLLAGMGEDAVSRAIDDLLDSI